LPSDQGAQAMTITLTREEAQQVLDAMEAMQTYTRAERKGLRIFDEAIETLRARLAQPEPKPVAWMLTELDGTPLIDCGDLVVKQRPVLVSDKTDCIPLYTAPPQREWQGLTDEEIRNEANHHVFDESFFNGAVWARGKIKEKNNG